MKDEGMHHGGKKPTRLEVGPAARRRMLCGRDCVRASCFLFLLLTAATQVYSGDLLMLAQKGSSLPQTQLTPEDVWHLGDLPLRCKNGSLVQYGDDEGSVLRNCGEPYRKEGLSPEARTNTTVKWFYNMGSADFIYSVTFKKGKVNDIKQEGRGFATPYR